MDNVGKMIHNKEDAMHQERQDMPKVIKWLENLFGCTFQDTSKSDQLQGKDLLGSDNKFYEIKIRSAEYRDLYKKDILIETISNDKKDSDGWIYYSKADWLIYLYEPFDDLLGYKISMPALKRWWEINEHWKVWKKKTVPNEGSNTINRVVPLKFLDGIQITYLPGDASGYKIE